MFDFPTDDELPTGYGFETLLPGADVPEWAQVLNTNLLITLRGVHKIERVHTKILDVVEEIKPEVSGVIAGLQKNPMFRMLMGGK